MNKFIFIVGDTIVRLDERRQEFEPLFGKVVERRPNGDAVVEWEEDITSRPFYTTKLFHSAFQFRICNAQEEGYRLIRKGEIRKNKRKPKKIKIGDIVEILNGPKKGETGIIVKHSNDTYWHQIYLQNDMNFVWRETSEIRKL